MGFNIAIDGPAGAGKSTIAKRVAKELSFIYVDTGALYRALAVFMVDQGVDPADRIAVSEAAGRVEVAITYEEEVQQVWVNGENVTGRLRTEAAGNMASVISAIPEVRAALLELQRELAKLYEVVMDGRDIGTMVLPNAELKIYLTASVQTRADRRYKELIEKGEKADWEKIAADIEERDARDMNREISPLRQAKDAVLVDSSHLTIDEVTEQIKALYKERCSV